VAVARNIKAAAMHRLRRRTVMSRLILSAALGLSMALPGAALAQSVGGTGSGMNSNNGAMSGANITVDNGINANGTPKQQSPGVSMTNGPSPSGAAMPNDDGMATPDGSAGTNITGTAGAAGMPAQIGTPAPVGGPGGGLGLADGSGAAASATGGGGTGK
jgi:hypothetical protein